MVLLFIVKKLWSGGAKIKFYAKTGFVTKSYSEHILRSYAFDK